MTGYERGSVHLVTVVIAAAAIIGVLVFTFFQVMKGRDDLATDTVKTFNDCKRLRMNQVLETYPEQCITESGKKIIDSSQKVEDSNTATTTMKQFTSRKHAITFTYPNTWNVSETVKDDQLNHYVSEVVVTNATGVPVAQLRTGGQYGGACAEDTPKLEATHFGTAIMTRSGFAGVFGFATTAIKDTDGNYRLVYGITKSTTGATTTIQCPNLSINYDYTVPSTNKALGSVQFGRWYNSADDGFSTLQAAKASTTKQKFIDVKKMIMTLAIGS